MRVLEFRCNLSPDMEEVAIRWLKTLRSVWNIGLRALEDFDEFRGYADSDSKGEFRKHLEPMVWEGEEHYLPCCPLPWHYHVYWIQEDGSIWRGEDEEGKVRTKPSSVEMKHLQREYAPYSKIVDDRSWGCIKTLPRVRNSKTEKKGSAGWKAKDGGDGRSCPIGTYRKPIIKSWGYQAHGGIAQVIKNDNILANSDIPDPLKKSLLEVPYKLRSGTLKGLSVAWDQYIKSKSGKAKVPRGKPRYKKSSECPNTIIDPNPNKKNVRIDGDYLSGVNGFGKYRFHLPGLRLRWRSPDGSIPEVCMFKLLRRATGWYVQLTGNIPKSLRLKKSATKGTGIDPGLLPENYVVHASGRRTPNPKFYRRSESRLKALQAKQDAKLKHRTILWLNHPDTTPEDIRRLCPSLSLLNAQNLRTAKTWDSAIAIAGNSIAQRLKWRHWEIFSPSATASKRQSKLGNKISRLHEKTRMRRKNYLQKLATWDVRMSSCLVLEDGLQSEKMRQKALPKLNPDGKGYAKNNAKAKSGLSKSLADAGHGAYFANIEAKCVQANQQYGDGTRRAIRSASKDSTRECPVCGKKHDMDPSIRWFVCDRCGWECDRDQKSGILLMLREFDKGNVAQSELPDAVLATLHLREKFLADQSEEMGDRSKKRSKSRRKRGLGVGAIDPPDSLAG